MKKIFVMLVMFAATTGSFAYSINIGNAVVVAQQEKTYKKVDAKEVPAAILKEITEKYPNYTITTAAVSDDKEYKLNITDGKAPVTVYYTASGEFVKEQK
nr:hypothetical protein [uncultured Flavobacterium sp.]